MYMWKQSIQAAKNLRGFLEIKIIYETLNENAQGKGLMRANTFTPRSGFPHQSKDV